MFCCNLGTSEQPTQRLYQMQLSSSLEEGKGEVIVYVYINNGWNLESSHYSLKTICPNIVLELVPAVLKFARCDHFSRYVNPSEPARFHREPFFFACSKFWQISPVSKEGLLLLCLMSGLESNAKNLRCVHNRHRLK